jgi:hypothetical protein
MTAEAGVNYFISQFSFGDLTHQEVLHSAGLFASEMLPAAREAPPRAGGKARP